MHEVYFLACNGPSIDDVGASRDTVFSGDTTGSWFLKPTIFIKEKLGGGLRVYRRTSLRANFFTFPLCSVAVLSRLSS